MAEAWFDTRRPTGLVEDERTWKLMELMCDELRESEKIEYEIRKYIPNDLTVSQMVEAYLTCLGAIFRSQNPFTITESRTKTIRKVLDTLKYLKDHSPHTKGADLKNVTSSLRSFFKLLSDEIASLDDSMGPHVAQGKSKLYVTNNSTHLDQDALQATLLKKYMEKL